MNICPDCGTELIDEQNNRCVTCGTEIQTNLTAEEDNSYEELKRTINEQREYEREFLKKQNSLSNNYLLGFIGALLGGLVGAIPWALVSSWGWFVGWLGYLIAIAASKGYDLMKVKVSMTKLWCVIGAVVISVFAGQIMSDMIVIATDDELSGMLWYVFDYFTENFGEYLSINAENLTMGLIFAALGGFSVLRDIKKETAMLKELEATYPDEIII